MRAASFIGFEHVLDQAEVLVLGGVDLETVRLVNQDVEHL
jgi:hypothetical protein